MIDPTGLNADDYLAIEKVCAAFGHPEWEIAESNFRNAGLLATLEH